MRREVIADGRAQDSLARERTRRRAPRNLACLPAGERAFRGDERAVERMLRAMRHARGTVASLAALALVCACRAEDRASPNRAIADASAPRSRASRPSEQPVASATAAAPPAASTAPPDACADLVAGGPIALPSTNLLRGVDASSLAPWRSLRAAGVAFGFAGATHGLAKIGSFGANFAAMKECGLARGAYHFLTDRADGATQARAFLEQVGADAGELGPAVDIEKPPRIARATAASALRATSGSSSARSFIGDVESRTGRKPIVYVVEPFFNQCLCGTPRFREHPLWLAGYPKFDMPARIAIGGWTRWAIYQHAGNVKVGASVVDLDVFDGTRDELVRAVAGR